MGVDDGDRRSQIYVVGEQGFDPLPQPSSVVPEGDCLAPTL